MDQEKESAHGFLQDDYSKRIPKTATRGAVTGRLQFSQRQTPPLNKLTCLYLSAQRAREPLQSHAPQEAENMPGTLILGKIQ